MLRERHKIAMLLAEFLGTAILTTIALSVTTNVGNPYFIAIGVGLALAALAMIFGKVSGAHLNPAVTIGLLTCRRVKVLPALVYVAMQILGGLAAYGLFSYLTNHRVANSGHYDSRILVSEAAGAFVFSLGWAATLYNRYEGGKAAAVVGASLAVGILTASFVSGGIINPAVALGMRSWVWGTYALGPVLGAVIGFNLYALLFAPAEELVKMEAGPKKRK
ncbi:MAG TPA: aquaporin [Patescibacteria group bacterium]|nr:aquaporin [Patescibacteria group bacterium]